MAIVRRLQEADAEAYRQLRRDALEESPLAFGASPATDFSASPEAVREQFRPGSPVVVIGAFDGEHLAGMVGLLQARHAKAQHKVQLWGMYVSPPSRHLGLGTALLDAALQHARAMPGVSWVQLGVTSGAPAARELYERAGFTLWGTEPEALRHDGTAVVEFHMALQLT